MNQLGFHILSRPVINAKIPVEMQKWKHAQVFLNATNYVDLGFVAVFVRIVVEYPLMHELLVVSVASRIDIILTYIFIFTIHDKLCFSLPVIMNQKLRRGFFSSPN